MNHEPAAALTREAGYIGSADARLFSWLHCRADRRHRGVAAVICPPLGVDYMNSHRALRHVADRYARAGIPALRFDYLGTGDSADLDPGADLWRNCLESIAVAVDALRRETGCRSIGLFGFRIGASLAGCHARDNPAAFLALWAPVNRGKRYLREIRLLQQLNLEQDAGAGLEAAGLIINEATARSLESMDLLAAPPASDRVLVIPADEVDNEDALCEAWRGGCDEVRQLALEGSAGMLVDAHFTRVPHAAIDRLVRETLRPARDLEPQAALPPRASEIDIAGAHPVRESLWQDTASALFLIASVPPEPRPALPLIVFLNSGANHHAGPNRIYVNLCRRLGGLGFPCLRIDLPGLGDAFVDDPAGENVTYLPQLSRHIDRVLDNALRREPGRRIIVAGLCSGAYGAFVSAIELSGRNIVEAILINPLTFYWEEGMSLEFAPSRDYQDWNWYMQSLRRGDKWQKLLRGDVDFGKLAATLVKGAKLKAGGQLSRWNALRPSAGDGVITGHLPTDLARARANRVQLTLFLADSDPGLKIILTNAGDSFKQMIKRGELSAYLIENADHTFSLRDSRERFLTLVVEHLSDGYLDPERPT